MKTMRFPTLSKTGLVVLAVIGVIFFVMIQPTPHWKETSSQSCVLCGNRRWIATHYKWWKYHSMEKKLSDDYPIPAGHEHDWWEYSHTYISWGTKWAVDKNSTYRDDTHVWIGASTNQLRTTAEFGIHAESP